MTQLENMSTPSAALDQNSTLICVVEMSLKSWLVAGMVPGIERQPLKKLEADEAALYRLVLRWKAEAERAGRRIARIALAFEAGRDGFWLARWLRARGIEAWVIHPTSIAVSRDHRRPKTDRLDTQMQCEHSWAGCAESRATAGWPPSQHSSKRMPSARRASEKPWLPSVPASLTEQSLRSFAWASAALTLAYAKRENAWHPYARQRVCASRQIPLPRSTVTWPVLLSSKPRSQRSRQRAWSV